MRLLERLRHDLNILRAEELSSISEPRFAPRLDDEIKDLLETLAAALHLDVIAAVVQRECAATGSELQPPARDDIEHRGLLREPNRMMQRQQVYREAEPQPRGPL